MSARANCTEGLGVVVALPAEARSLGARRVRAGGCVRWRQGWLAVAGIGRHNALRATERLLACGVGALASVGVAGAIDARLAPGDLLIAARVRFRDDDARGFPTDTEASARLARRLGADLPVYHGTLWSAAQACASSADKRALAERCGALAVDQEAAAVAAVAQRAQLPFLAIKAICDPVAREIPPPILRALDGSGGFSFALLAAIVGGGPASWRAARRLARDFASARQTLALVARCLALPA